MIWHLLPLPRWQSAGDGPFVPGTEDTAGQDTAPFVHASPDEPTLLAVANDRFADSALPLVALALDESRLSAPVRFEAADPAPPPGVAAGTLFPHVYGPVELTAVTEVRFARRDPAGRFTALDPRPPTAEVLDLVPHPEGGWYRQTWAAGPSYQPDGYPGRRAAATGIYFLLHPGHRIGLAHGPLGRGLAVALRRPADAAAGRRRTGPGTGSGHGHAGPGPGRGPDPAARRPRRPLAVGPPGRRPGSPGQLRGRPRLRLRRLRGAA